MPIVRLKTIENNRKINELLSMFTLPSVDYTNGYQAKPRPGLVGGSAMNSIEAYNINAVRELLERTIIR